MKLLKIYIKLPVENDYIDIDYISELGKLIQNDPNISE